jgi:hypothetical protein
MSDKPVTEAATYTTNTREEIPFMPSTGFEPAKPAIEQQNYALDGKAIGIGKSQLSCLVTIGTTDLTFISSFSPRNAFMQFVACHEELLFFL